MKGILYLTREATYAEAYGREYAVGEGYDPDEKSGVYFKVYRSVPSTGGWVCWVEVGYRDETGEGAWHADDPTEAVIVSGG
jgi:hypothetical protein